MANNFNNIALLFLIISLWTNWAIIVFRFTRIWLPFPTLHPFFTSLRKSALFQIHFLKQYISSMGNIGKRRRENCLLSCNTLWKSNNFSTHTPCFTYWQISGIIDCNWHPLRLQQVCLLCRVVISHSFISWFCAAHLHGFTSFAHTHISRPDHRLF